MYRLPEHRQVPWTVREDPDVFGTAHVVPTLDTIEHEFENCTCNPEIQPFPQSNGSMCWIIGHFRQIDNLKRK